MSKHYKHLSREERYSIKEMRDIGLSINSISKKMNRSKGTISMEIQRNKVRNKYMPCIAQEKYDQRMHQQELLKIEKTPKLLNYIKDAMIKKKWSPDAIAGKLKLDNDKSCLISTESIYRFVYTSPVAAKLNLHRYLPSKKYKRQERGKRRQRVLIPQRVSIHEREEVAAQKIELGHFEADLTFHKGNQSMNIGSIVDKKTQKIMLVLNNSKRSAAVTTGFLGKIKNLPHVIRKTITMDNGKEFVGHVSYRLAGFKTFFCDPYKPRQKALVEKMNSMIHRILPKNIDITTVTQKQLDNVADILNNMPRRIFGYKTPNEIWAENL
jgi:transposase, IS30 family